MSEEELLRALLDFKRTTLYQAIEECRQDLVRSTLESLATPVEDLPSVIRHIRLGGVAEGLMKNPVDVLIAELELRQKGGLK